LRLCQLHLVRTGIDQNQKIAFVDLLTFPEIDCDELAIDAALNADLGFGFPPLFKR